MKDKELLDLVRLAMTERNVSQLMGGRDEG